MHNAIKGDRNMFLKANWEAKTDNILVKNMVKNRVDDLKRRKATDLVARRSKLAQLLAIEDRQYESEFLQNQETPEQVRAKMAMRLEQLKEQREAERQQ